MKKNKKFLTYAELFGQRLRIERKKAGISQRELAQRCGFKSAASISNIEKGKAPINIQGLVIIADTMNTDLHWLITGKLSPKQNYYNAINRLAYYITWEISRSLDEREQIDFELNELLEKQKKGEPTEQVLIDLLRSNRAQIQDRLSKVAQDQHWLKEAILSTKEQNNDKYSGNNDLKK
jgi:transcriptional regulator with XRE-family HTH domain